MLFRRQASVHLYLPSTPEEFEMISLLGTKSSRKGCTTFRVDLVILDTLLGKDWYSYQKKEDDVSAIHRDSLYIFVQT